ncbi:vacuolar protein sorting-associated protein VTA1 homolog [Centruroides vittatus]|uniref:vacuolar protein sorting-associated protein VTA1 homolog n=1 Tax=Centruroides vittatus TaxID=120091 RepID=UPI00351002A6
MANIKVPESLKAVQPYIRASMEHRQRDIVVSYWCYFYACQSALKIDKTSEESVAFLTAALDWLEKVKKEKSDNEAILNEVVAQAHMENYALKLFLWADNEDRSARFNKNVVKAFYTAGLLFDVLAVFGELTDEATHNRKYAKWKATYIHNCLKNGETPIPGPANQDSDEFSEDTQEQSWNNPSTSEWNQPTNYVSPPALPTPNSGVPNSLLTPAPGVHAPPSTPSGSTLPSPSGGSSYTPTKTPNGIVLCPEDFHKAQKYCKWAGSALQYEDVSTAIDNLQKALLLLTTGKDE